MLNNLQPILIEPPDDPRYRKREGKRPSHKRPFRILRPIEYELLKQGARKKDNQLNLDVLLLTALTYMMIRNGWSLRQAERWCRENMELLRRFGYDRPNPPSYVAFKRTLDTMDPKMIQRISAKIKYLKGEVRTLWF